MFNKKADLLELDLIKITTKTYRNEKTQTSINHTMREFQFKFLFDLKFYFL